MCEKGGDNPTPRSSKFSLHERWIIDIKPRAAVMIGNALFVLEIALKCALRVALISSKSPTEEIRMRCRSIPCSMRAELRLDASSQRIKDLEMRAESR